MKMRIKKSNKIILLTLLLILVVFINCLFATEAQKAEALKRIDAEEPPSDAAFEIERPMVVYSAGNLRDPFLTTIPQELGAATKNKEEEKLPSLTIQGLIFGPKFPQAIINNKVLKVGDQISGATVTAINKDEISVLFNDKYYKLTSPLAIAKTSQIPGGKK